MNKKQKSNVKRIENLEEKYEELKEEIEQLKDKNIIKELSERRFPGSTKYLYTYDEIAELNGVSKNRVQELAKNNGLTRRKSSEIS